MHLAIASSIVLCVVTLGRSAVAQAPVWPPPEWSASAPGAPPTPPAPAAPATTPTAPSAAERPQEGPPASPAPGLLTLAPPIAPAVTAAPARVAPLPPSIARPTSVEAYARARRRVKEEIRTAERHDRGAEAERLERELDTLNDWYREDVERTSTGAFVGGILMTSVGGVSLLTGIGLQIASIATEASHARHAVTEGLQTGADVTLLSGVALLGAGIPLMVWGGERVMADQNANAPRPRFGLALLPAGAGLDATF